MSNDQIAAWEKEAVVGEGVEDWEWRQPLRSFKLPLSFRVGDKFTRDITIQRMDGFCDNLLLSDNDDESVLSRMMEVLSRSTVRIGDKERPDGTGSESLPRFFIPDYERMPLASKTLVMIRLRQLSTHLPTQRKSGHKFLFRDECPKCRVDLPSMSCRLDNMPVKFLSDEICEREFQEFDDGEFKIKWRYASGKDEFAIVEMMKEQKASFPSALLAATVLEINGKELGDKPESRLLAVNRLSKSARLSLIPQMDAGGVITTIDMECTDPKCRKKWSRPLPWMQTSFFFPSVE